jgi:hypothetical protein
MGKKLVDKLKLVLGRQLSPKQMANAREESRKFTIAAHSSDEPMKIDRIERFPSGEFVRFRQRFSYMTTPDASHGWNRPHTNYYPSRTVVEVYDLKGRLKEKTVSDGNLYVGRDHITRVFNPPGRLIGKRGEKVHLGP